MRELVIVTCFSGREAISRAFLEHIDKLGVPLVAATDNDGNVDLLKKYGHRVVIGKWERLGGKFLSALHLARGMGNFGASSPYERVMILGSDDLVAPWYIEEAIEQCREDQPWLLPTTGYVWDMDGKRGILKHNRHRDLSFGAGMVLHHTLLERHQYRLWHPRLRKGLDSNLVRNLGGEPMTRVEDPRPAIVCLKSKGLNIWPYGVLVPGGESAPPPTWADLERPADISNLPVRMPSATAMRLSNAISGLHHLFIKKFPYPLYDRRRDRNRHTIFVGMYRGEDIKVLKRHKGKATILWCGTDALRAAESPEAIKEALRLNNGIRHVAKSEYIQRSLTKAGIISEFIPVCPTIPIPNVKPKGDAVYIYTGDGGKKYGGYMVDRIREGIAPIELIVSRGGEHPPDAMTAIYERCFLGLRLTQHDGIPNTVVELAMMGRRSVYNGKLPGAIPWTGLSDVISIIKDQYAIRDRNEDGHDLAKAMAEYLDVGDAWIYGGTAKPPEVTIMMNSVGESKDIFDRALNSVLAQRGVRIKVLVCTIEGDPCAEWAAGHDNVKVLISPQKGIYQQLNYMAPKVTTEYVSYFSSNDIMLPEKCIKEIMAMKDNGASVCNGAYVERSPSGKDQPRHLMAHKLDNLLRTSGNPISDCSMMTNKVLQRFLPFQKRWGNSAYHDLWLRILKEIGDEAMCASLIPGWIYLRDPDSQSMRRKLDPKWAMRNKLLRESLLEHHRLS